MLRRVFLEHTLTLLGSSLLGVTSKANCAREVNEILHNSQGQITRSIPAEAQIVNKESGQAAWYYRGDLYLLRPTHRLSPNSPLECDIKSASKVPGCRRTESGFEMGPQWMTLDEIRVIQPGFNLDQFVREKTSGSHINWERARYIPTESLIINTESREVAWLYRGELYPVRLTYKNAPNSQLECDIQRAGKVLGCRRNPEGGGYQMMPEWRTLAEIIGQHPDFDVVNFISLRQTALGK